MNDINGQKNKVTTCLSVSSVFLSFLTAWYTTSEKECMSTHRTVIRIFLTKYLKDHPVHTLRYSYNSISSDGIDVFY